LHEGGGDAALHGQDVARAGPGSVNALGLQARAKHLDELGGEQDAAYVYDRKTRLPRFAAPSALLRAGFALSY
jgi:hypothetical protein